METHKICTKCKENKPLTGFNIENKMDGRRIRRSECKACKAKRDHLRHLRNCERVRGLGESKRKKENILKSNLKSYGLTLEKFYDMVASQEGKCLICEKVPENERLAVDHCHKTKQVRGLLCRPCNSAIGFFKDSIRNIHRAKQYLMGVRPYTDWL